MDNAWLDALSATSLKIHSLNDELAQWTASTLSSAAPSLVQGGRPFSSRQCAGSTFAVLQASMIATINAELTAAQNALNIMLGGWLLPVITGVSPNTGPLAGGNSITISGSYLQGASAVMIGGIAATNVQPVDGVGLQVTAVVPAGIQSGTANVQVTTLAGTGISLGLFTYLQAPPTVVSISPNNGSHNGGTAVTITGTNFLGTTAVQIGGVAVTSFVVVNATTITAVTGNHPAVGIVNVTVTTPNGIGTGVGIYTYKV